ncbi:phosphatase PAP2 family protein [Streptomyces sp. NPDC058657]|uniref:phosphatase PAP2 family protein n=1 Tax=unclassified Streptomyces TaxID=2593676 RepID=UPI003659A025
MTGRTQPAVLPPPSRAWLALIGALAALTVVVAGVLYAGRSRPGTVDAWLQPPAEGVRAPWRHIALATDFLGEPAGAALLVAALVTACLLMRWPRAAVLVVAAPGVAVGTTKLLKPLVGRTIYGDNLSYPSGHTAFLAALALTVALLAASRLGLGRRAGMFLALTAALVAGAAMGWAQVVLGAHYATDTLGGCCTAVAVTTATAWLVDTTADTRSRARAHR